MKFYSVLNVEQIEGRPEDNNAKPIEPKEKMQLIDAAASFFNATGAAFRHGGKQEYYAIGPDVIQRPISEAFLDAENHAPTSSLMDCDRGCFVL